MKKGILNIIYSLWGILGGYIISNIIYTVPTVIITTGKNGDFSYTAYIMLNVLIGTFFYMYITKIIKSIISAKNTYLVSSNAKRCNLILYLIALIVSSYFILNRITIEDTPLFATIIIGIFNGVFAIKLHFTTWFDNNFYIAPIKLNNEELDKNVINENKKRLLFNFLGFITGSVFSILLFFTQKTIFNYVLSNDNGTKNILIIILGVFIIPIVILFVIEKVIMKFAKKKYNKEIKNYYTIKDFFVDSFNIVYTLLAYSLFIYFLNTNNYLTEYYYLALIYVIYILVMKKIITKFLPQSYNPDYVSSYSGYTEGKYFKEDKDKKSIKYGFLNNGTSYFSMDIGSGINLTTYTDKDGNKTDVTSFDITDDLEYKSIKKR